jgi:hypothetical protein
MEATLPNYPACTLAVLCTSFKLFDVGSASLHPTFTIVLALAWTAGWPDPEDLAGQVPSHHWLQQGAHQHCQVMPHTGGCPAVQPYCFLLTAVICVHMHPVGRRHR